mmetsp:Transcript_3026/g.7215  ORF Transcript_3026/g.7215 Transcript_3026/m.7215 type:complete len:217 (-) Transcript_3026:62-712(-)
MCLCPVVAGAAVPFLATPIMKPSHESRADNGPFVLIGKGELPPARPVHLAVPRRRRARVILHPHLPQAHGHGHGVGHSHRVLEALVPCLVPPVRVEIPRLVQHGEQDPFHEIPPLCVICDVLEDHAKALVRELVLCHLLGYGALHHVRVLHVYQVFHDESVQQNPREIRHKLPRQLAPLRMLQQDPQPLRRHLPCLGVAVDAGALRMKIDGNIPRL